jgi:hypothetical protein
MNGGGASFVVNQRPTERRLPTERRDVADNHPRRKTWRTIIREERRGGQTSDKSFEKLLLLRFFNNSARYREPGAATPRASHFF